MCFGNTGPSASALYAAQGPKFGALPSLAIDKVKRDKPKLEDVVKRKGYQARSLLMPTNTGGY